MHWYPDFPAATAITKTETVRRIYAKHIKSTSSDNLESTSGRKAYRQIAGCEKLPESNRVPQHGRMTKELYDFLNLYCGFIAHYNIHGFRQAYAAPRDFTDVFIRHFDREHRYFNAT